MGLLDCPKLHRQVRRKRTVRRHAAACTPPGSFAAAARALGLVPSALTYRVRQIEDALDVLLFDRSSRQARLTPAGSELLREGGRLLEEIDAMANRVKRVATGWEPQFTIAVDSIISQTRSMMELCEAFLAWNSHRRPACGCATRPCRARWRR
jgi:DNA-binding transcriptional LysR family regulator